MGRAAGIRRPRWRSEPGDGPLARPRFASEARLLAHHKNMILYEGVKGDLLKASALRLLKAAQRFVDKGVLQWR